MLARLRIALPDRPGSLGRVTTTLGSAGADIASVDVLQNELGRALDDVFVVVRDRDHLDSAVTAVDALPGVEVMGLQASVPPTTGHADLELAGQVLCTTDLASALTTLVEGAPDALGADWAALLDYTDPGRPTVVRTSLAAPPAQQITATTPLRLAPISVRLSDPQAGASTIEGAALVPIEDDGRGCGAALLLVRTDGPGFHPREMWRLGQLGRVLGLSARVPA